LIDITRLLYRRMRGMLPTGIDRVGLEYVRHFGARARAVISYRGRAGVLPQDTSKRAFGALLDGGEPEPVLGAWLLSRGTVWDAVFASVEKGILLNTGHYGLEDDDYAARLRAGGARTVVFVHDLIPITHPQFCRPGERERHVARTRTGLAIASGVIVNSHDTKRQLERFATAEGLRVPATLVAPLASPLPAMAPRARPIAEPYFVVLATIEPRKNHKVLLEAWTRIGRDAPKLLVIGQRGWECDTILAEFKRSTHVSYKPGCDDAELVSALAHAEALLLPSFAEGFGIPVAEALTLGVPVIASDLAVFREFASDIPEYLEPDDVDAWARAIMDRPRREAQKARMARFRAPTWAGHFHSVERFLGELP
jgi:glycosyltransferase involved in cell wall biosynthesis